MTQKALGSSFDEVITDVYHLLENADKQTSILNVAIPSEFKQSDPTKILDTFYATYRDGLDNVPTTTMQQKFTQGGYSDFYELYQDLKVSCSIKIKDYKMGRENYNNVDFFYKFSSELIIREAGLLKISLFNNKPSDAPSNYSELEQQISNDFDKISYGYTNANGEVVTDMTEIDNPNASAFQNSHQYGLSVSNQPAKIKMPLFTSSILKSEVDNNLTIVPGDLGLSKTIPLLNNSGSSGATFESLNLPNPKIPLPTAQPTTMLDGFHVLNWLPIGAPEWLSYKSKTLQPILDSKLTNEFSNEFRLISTINESVKSFAPTIDSQGYGVPHSLKASVWLSRVGLDKIDELRKQYFKNVGIKQVTSNGSKNGESTNNGDIIINGNGTNDKFNDDNNVTNNNNHQNGTRYITSEELTDYDQTQRIPIKNLLDWDPNEIEILEALKQEESNIKSAKNLQKFISKELLKLNKLRQERFLKSEVNNVLPATNEEKILYNKITKLISLTVSLYKITPANLPIEFSKKVPVLMAEYSGTLPGILGSRNKQNRLPNLRGSYKKKR